ncbi:hypothetical protein V3C99_005974 [Haemonchus contortus]
MLVLLISSVYFVVCASQERPPIVELPVQPSPGDTKRLTGKALVDYVNSRQSLFKAEYSPEAEHRLGHLMKLDFIKNARKRYNIPKAEKSPINVQIPESFDSREKWPNCSSISLIRDQSNCGSCWAVSAAETMSDRICVQSKGEKQVLISDVDILSCCGDECGYGCEGGLDHKAWEYARDFGVCTGGLYEQPHVCKPYPFHPCGKHGWKSYPPCPMDHLYKTPLCRKYCQYGYDKRYEEDKFYAKKVYILDEDEEEIQKEMLKYGPVQAAFSVYEDFSYYRKGIYKHTYGRPRGGHAVKIVGWGVENGTKYWTVANSWNDDWGENGYFRILRGENHCDFESYVVSGTFKV